MSAFSSHILPGRAAAADPFIRRELMSMVRERWHPSSAGAVQVRTADTATAASHDSSACRGCS